MFICPRQGFLVLYTICEQAEAWLTDHSRVGSWPYLQALDYARNACQGQTL